MQLVKAIVQRRYGGPETFELAEIERPPVGPENVLVRVLAASVNPADYHLMRGHLLVRPHTGLRRPKELVKGHDVAGVVEAVGDAVMQFAPGDEVYGARAGAFAEYVCGRERNFVSKPARLSFEQAAAMPIAGVTALQGLRDHAGLRPGQHVAITGAAGGVGSFAVQIAKVLGAEVTGVCRTENVELVRALGADHVVDYTREDFTRSGPFDVIFDNGGGWPLSMHRRAVRPDGLVLLNSGSDLRLILTGFVASKLLQRPVRQFVAKVKRDDLLVLNRLVDEGKLTPLVDRSYSLTDTRAAVAYLMQRHPRGKVVVTA